MFTLKLYRRRNGQLVTKILSLHHVTVMDIGKGKTLEIWAHKTQQGGDYENFYVGEREADMMALTDENHFGWGLLENAEGNTTEYFRPTSYG